MEIKNKPLVTVITITYNIVKAGRVKSLDQCIKSVRNQTYPNIEHLIIDGKSTDGTSKILENYRQKGWIKYISEKDSGRYDAMNKGIINSHGKYITFLHSDDYYHNRNGVNLSVERLLISDADFSYAPIVNLDDKKGSKQTIVPDIFKVFFNITPNHQTIFYKKSTITEAGMYQTKYKCLGDYDLTVRLCLSDKISTYVNKSFATYRLGGFSEYATTNGTVNKEMVDIYFQNYNKLCKLTKNECTKIVGELYNGSYINIPNKLALKLKIHPKYFSYNDYIFAVKQSKINQKVIVNNKINLTNSEIKLILTIRKLKFNLIPESSLRKRIFDRIKKYL